MVPKVILSRSCFYSGILILIQEITTLLLDVGSSPSFMGIDSPLPYTQWINLSKSRVAIGMNFVHGGTGVFDTWMKEGNMTTQINSFKQYISDGVYNQRDLDESIAVVSNAGNDYTVLCSKPWHQRGM
ncbi:hypothetical protein C5167_000430 [Papaver somniferum]|uniref:Uncharacterized protein n=1 Tax=Papaver somniferum TaxID=3469 RepID=A0A4Y7KVU6_PAPSO|nr:hypothetical protein C5167_000430 [Papaver somniferum]